jgi:transposase
VYVKTQTLTREQCYAIYERGREETVDFILSLITFIPVMQEQIESLNADVTHLKERNQQLELQGDKDSHNSHKPPSSDGLQRATKSQRQKSSRSSGGQKEHKGTTLQRVEKPEFTVKHTIKKRCRCGKSLNRVKAHAIEKRQVFDIPIVKIQVTEHQSEVKTCPSCGTINTAVFPDGITKATQYGKNVKSLATYLMQFQLLPSERTKELLQDIFGCHVSEGTLFNWNKEIHTVLEEPEQQIKEQLMQSPEINADETGLFCNGKLHWLHVASTLRLTHYRIHSKRGSEAMDIFSTYNGTLVHDFWKSYFDFYCNHGLCNSHLILELIFIYEQFRQQWAKDIIRVLTRMEKSVARAKRLGKTSLLIRLLHSHRLQYDNIVKRGLRINPRLHGSPHRRGRKKQTKQRNLVERLRDYASEVLAFMYNFDVPFTNNQAERDIRMAKVKQKISGTFRSQLGAEIFCRVRGYVSTARKNGLSAFDALRRAFDGNSFVPILNHAE